MLKLKRMLVVAGILMLSLGLNIHGAEKSFPDLGAEEQELRKNTTWTIEGIYRLSKSKDRKLAITPVQAQKILPIYQGLIDKKVIRTEIPDRKRLGPMGPGGRNPQGPGRPGGPGMDPKRQAEFMERIEFGKKEIRKIDSILTKAQVNFIDTMVFQPEKYGFFERNSDPDGSSPPMGGGAQSNGARQPDAKQLQKMQEAQKRLVRLNQDVLKILKQLAAKAK